ncbi:TIR domain-containing protein [bacterium]|nr:TIR domain-containing protein [bacterium]
MSALVFVSYSRQDPNNAMWFSAPGERRSLIPWLDAALGAEVEVWWDTTGLPPGKKWREFIEAKIAQADVALLLVTQLFLASEFVQGVELDLIGRRGDDIEIVPVLMEPCDGPRASFFRDLQFVPVVNGELMPLIRCTQDDSSWTDVRYHLILSAVRDALASAAGRAPQRSTPGVQADEGLPEPAAEPEPEPTAEPEPAPEPARAAELAVEPEPQREPVAEPQPQAAAVTRSVGHWRRLLATCRAAVGRVHVPCGPRRRWAIAALIATLVVVGGGLTVQHVGYPYLARSWAVLYWRLLTVETPNDASVRYYLGLAYLKTGRTEEAIRELRYAVTLKPSSADSTWVLAYAYATVGQQDSAVYYFKVYLSLEKEGERVAERANYARAYLAAAGASYEGSNSATY